MRIIKWNGKTITLERWGEQGFWGIPKSALLGETTTCEKRQEYGPHSGRLWAATITGFLSNGFPVMEYHYFDSPQSILRAYPNAFPLKSCLMLWDFTDHLRKRLNLTDVIAGAPSDT